MQWTCRTCPVCNSQSLNACGHAGACLLAQAAGGWEQGCCQGLAITTQYPANNPSTPMPMWGCCWSAGDVCLGPHAIGSMLLKSKT